MRAYLDDACNPIEISVDTLQFEANWIEQRYERTRMLK